MTYKTEIDFTTAHKYIDTNIKLVGNFKEELEKLGFKINDEICLEEDTDYFGDENGMGTVCAVVTMRAHTDHIGLIYWSAMVHAQELDEFDVYIAIKDNRLDNTIDPITFKESSNLRCAPTNSQMVDMCMSALKYIELLQKQ